MYRKWGWGCAALLMIAHAGTACGETELNFAGFASIGAGRISEPSLTYFDYENEWSFDSDTMLALQAIAEVTDQLSFTGQVISKGFTFDERSPYEPELNWLFASYEVSESLRVRAGRLRTPLFLFSESLDTGFSYPWVRPPVSMYAHFLEPFDNYEGMDATWFTKIAGNESEFGFFAGSTEDVYCDRDIDLHKTFVFTAQTQLDTFKLRYCYNWNRISIYNPALEAPAQLYRTFAVLLDEPVYAEIANSAQLDEQVMQYHAVGVQWEKAGWQIIGEKFQTVGPSKQFSFENDGWYVSIARQIDDFMPYVTLGEYASKVDPDIGQRVASTYNINPAGSNIFLDVLRAETLATIEDLSIRQGSLAVGVRHELTRTSALKFETEYFKLENTGQMTFDGSEDEPDHALATTIVFDVVF